MCFKKRKETEKDDKNFFCSSTEDQENLDLRQKHEKKSQNM